MWAKLSWRMHFTHPSHKGWAFPSRYKALLFHVTWQITMSREMHLKGELGLFMFVEESNNPDVAELEMIWILIFSQSQILLGFLLPAQHTWQVAKFTLWQWTPHLLNSNNLTRAVWLVRNIQRLAIIKTHGQPNASKIQNTDSLRYRDRYI